jgi:hypothetical protein
MQQACLKQADNPHPMEPTVVGSQQLNNICGGVCLLHIECTAGRHPLIDCYAAANPLLVGSTQELAAA